MAAPTIGTRIVRGACPQDCPDTCAFLYHVENGRLVAVTGDPTQNVRLLEAPEAVILGGKQIPKAN